MNVSENQGVIRSRCFLWRDKRTPMKRRLIVALGIIITISAISFLIYVTTIENISLLKNETIEHEEHEKTADKKEMKKDYYCLTPECIHTSSNVLKFIDSSVDPCEDFYQFACGKFLKDAIIPHNKTSTSPSSIINDNLDTQMQSVIEEPSIRQDPKPYKLLKRFYNTCINDSYGEGSKKVLCHILNNLNGWPILKDNWNENMFDWKNFTYKCRKIGLSTNIFMKIDVEIDKRYASKRIIVLNEATLEFGKEIFVYKFQNERVQAYYEYMVDVAVMLGADKIVAKTEMKAALQFEIDLSQSQLAVGSEKTPDDYMSVSQLQKIYKRIPWLDYLNNIINISDLTITYDEVIYVKVRLFDLIALLAITPKRIQANYAIFKIISSLAPFLKKELRDRREQYSKIVHSSGDMPPRWKECIHEVSKHFHLAAGALYISKYLSEQSKSELTEIVSDIHSQLYITIEKTNWMDTITKDKALEKAQSMNFHIGYPDKLTNITELEEYYLKLNVSSTNNYLDFLLNLELFRSDHVFSQLRKPVDRTKWATRTSPVHVNAFYDPEENKIDLPVGILQAVFFNSDRPRYMNYGAIGYVIGHEMMHGFDGMGRKYDKNGNFKEWWTKNAEKIFLQNMKCIVSQYGRYIDPETKMELNGENTQDEDFADNAGIKLSYLAYKAWVERNEPEPLLPGLNYTQNQLFWISAATTWCTKTKKYKLKRQVLNGIHSPARFRVQVPFSNADSFADDFSCPVGSTMNPKKKCDVF